MKNLPEAAVAYGSELLRMGQPPEQESAPVLPPRPSVQGTEPALTTNDPVVNNSDGRKYCPRERDHAWTTLGEGRDGFWRYRDAKCGKCGAKRRFSR